MSNPSIYDVYEFYLTASDLSGPTPVVVREVRLKEVFNPKTKGADKKIILVFHKFERVMALNKTQAEVMAELTGTPNYMKWPGARLMLSPVQLRRDTVTIEIGAQKAEGGKQKAEGSSQKSAPAGAVSQDDPMCEWCEEHPSLPGVPCDACAKLEADVSGHATRAEGRRQKASPAPTMPTQKTNGNGHAASFELRAPEAVKALVGSYAGRYEKAKRDATPAQRALVATSLELCFVGNDQAQEARRMVQKWITGFESLAAEVMPGAWVLALIDWLKPYRNKDMYMPGKQAEAEAGEIYKLLLSALPEPEPVVQEEEPF